MKVWEPLDICLQGKCFCSTRNALTDFDGTQTLVSPLELHLVNADPQDMVLHSCSHICWSCSRKIGGWKGNTEGNDSSLEAAFFFLASDLNRLQLRDTSSPNSTCSIEGSHKVLEEPGHSLDAQNSWCYKLSLYDFTTESLSVLYGMCLC